jgi:ZIP family zinc transporter
MSDRKLPTWVIGVAPLALLVLLVFTLLKTGPLGVLRGSFPPVEELTIDQILLPAPGVVEVHVVNGGPEPSTIAQVMVDDAMWIHQIDGDRTIPRLGRRTITLAYPWVEGEPHQIKLLTSTGLTFAAEIAVATQSPQVDATYLTTFALLGTYAGIVPVFLGLLWLPFLKRLAAKWLHFFLALTLGLLVFLGAEALHEAFEQATLLPSAFQGNGLVLVAALGTLLLLIGIGKLRQTQGENSPERLAFLIALGIGLHNLGEGLAIGTAYAGGEIALGAFLVIGFLIHNATEGLGIVAPLAGASPTMGRLVGLGALAGVPTVLGTWIGGFGGTPVWTALFLAVGAGAIAQVVWELGRFLARRSEGGLFTPLNAAGLLAGMLVMYCTGLFVAA